MYVDRFAKIASAIGTSVDLRLRRYWTLNAKRHRRGRRKDEFCARLPVQYKVKGVKVANIC